MNNKITYWLRWIAILPGAIFAGFLITFPLHWLLYIAFAHNETFLVFIELPPRSDIWIEQLLYPFVMAMAFISAGHYIAPKYKFKSTKQTLKDQINKERQPGHVIQRPMAEESR